jgi:hypothetical protein
VTVRVMIQLVRGRWKILRKQKGWNVIVKNALKGKVTAALRYESEEGVPGERLYIKYICPECLYFIDV